MRRGFPRLLTVIGVLAICLGSTSKSCRLITDNVENRDDLSFVTAMTLQDAGSQITDTFESGEPIQLVMTVRNELETSVEVEFPTTRTFDFVVVRADTADVVWQWSDDQPPFQQTPSVIEFAPEETQTFNVTWDQLSNINVPVRTGTYEARGVLVFSGFDSDPLQENQLGSPLVRFTIIED